MAVVGKIFILCFESVAAYWAAFIERYIYDEKAAEVTSEETKSEGMRSKFEYHPSKLWLIIPYQTGNVLISPLIGKLPI